MSSPSRGRLRLAFALLMFTAFVETLGSFLVLALLPFYGERFGAGPAVIGWLVAAFALAQLVTAPLWGRLSDRIGRKVVLLAGLAVAALAYLLFARADSLEALFLSRLLQGAGAGTVSVVFAYLADILPGERRAEAIGWVTAATSGAAMVGPLIGSLAARFDPAWPGWWCLAMAATAFVLVAVLLPRSSSAAAPADGGDVGDGAGPDGSSGEATDDRAATARLPAALWEVVRHPRGPGPLLVWTYAVGMLATSATFGVVGLLLERRFGIDEGTIWWFFSLLAGASLVIRVALLGPMVRRFGERRLMVVGAVCLGAATVLLPLPPTTGWLVVPILAFAMGQSLLYPCATALLSQVAERRRAGLLGQAMGVQQFYGGVSRVAGPVVGGWAFAQYGAASPFLACGLLVLAWAGLLAGRR